MEAEAENGPRDGLKENRKKFSSLQRNRPPRDIGYSLLFIQNYQLSISIIKSHKMLNVSRKKSNVYA